MSKKNENKRGVDLFGNSGCYKIWCRMTDIILRGYIVGNIIWMAQLCTLTLTITYIILYGLG